MEPWRQQSNLSWGDAFNWTWQNVIQPVGSHLISGGGNGGGQSPGALPGAGYNLPAPPQPSMPWYVVALIVVAVLVIAGVIRIPGARR